MAVSAILSSSFRRKCRPRRGGNFKHGFFDSRLEGIHENMRDRCYNPQAENYHRYGGKGITVCEEWRTDPAAFYKWAVANGYQDDLQIGRRKNALGYSPENCRWITHREQQSNRGNNRWLECNGERRTLTQWAEHTGLKRNRIYMRLENGWPIDQALGFAKRKR